jgi:hypothetical protein
MDALTSTPVYIGESHQKGNGHNGAGNGEAVEHVSPLITGHELARMHASASKANATAAQLLLDERRLVHPTFGQAMAVANGCSVNMRNAMPLTPETRARVADGEISLSAALKMNGLFVAYLAAPPEEQAVLKAWLKT